MMKPLCLITIHCGIRVLQLGEPEAKGSVPQDAYRFAALGAHYIDNVAVDWNKNEFDMIEFLSSDNTEHLKYFKKQDNANKKIMKMNYLFPHLSLQNEVNPSLSFETIYSNNGNILWEIVGDLCPVFTLGEDANGTLKGAGTKDNPYTWEAK